MIILLERYMFLKFCVSITQFPNPVVQDFHLPGTSLFLSSMFPNPHFSGALGS